MSCFHPELLVPQKNEPQPICIYRIPYLLCGNRHLATSCSSAANKDDDTDHSEDMPHKAIDLLEEASNILNSNALALRQGPQIVPRYGNDIPASPGPTETKDKDSQNTLTQV